MGGNKTYTRTYVENKTERCPTGFKSPDQKSYIITATRQVSKQYNGNELISTYATNWAPVPNAMACSKIETGYNYCWDGSSIFKQRTVYYNGNYVYSAWQLFGSCPPPPPPPPPSPAPTPAPSPAPKVDPFGPINSGGGAACVGEGARCWVNSWTATGGDGGFEEEYDYWDHGDGDGLADGG